MWQRTAARQHRAAQSSAEQHRAAQSSTVQSKAGRGERGAGAARLTRHPRRAAASPRGSTPSRSGRCPGSWLRAPAALPPTHPPASPAAPTPSSPESSSSRHRPPTPRTPCMPTAALPDPRLCRTQSSFRGPLPAASSSSRPPAADREACRRPRCPRPRKHSPDGSTPGFLRPPLTPARTATLAARCCQHTRSPCRTLRTPTSRSPRSAR
eukprot:1738771-Rhodomonas_salina.1